jgi:hypothetical protein
VQQKQKSMTMPPTTAHQCLADALQRMKVILARRSKCRSYSGEYKKYCEWVEDSNHCRVGGGSKYIGRAAIDAHFCETIISRGGQRNHINCIISAIQWAHDDIEQPGRPSKFIVCNGVVKAAFNLQQENWKNGDSAVHLRSDPHKGLKDLMPLADKIMIARNIHSGGCGDWGSLGMSFSWGCNASVQGALSQKFVYADLNLSCGFGPEKEGPRSRYLMLVLRKGDTHKDRSNTDKQVGVWRHKEYLLCSTFNTALHVIHNLSNDATINFHHNNMDGQASWWDKPLINYEASCQESVAMTAVYAATCLSQ